MRKFIVRDDDGAEYSVIETEEEKLEDDEVPASDEGLTPDEIAALKSLAARSADILKLLEVEAKEHEAVTAEDEDVEEKDVDEDEVVDTCKDSFGSVEKRTTDSKLQDSDALQEEIADAWKKRYGGK